MTEAMSLLILFSLFLLGCVCGALYTWYWYRDVVRHLHEECRFRRNEVQQLNEIINQKNRSLRTLSGWVRRKGLA